MGRDLITFLLLWPSAWGLVRLPFPRVVYSQVIQGWRFSNLPGPCSTIGPPSCQKRFYWYLTEISHVFCLLRPSDQAVADSQNISLEPSLLHRLLKKYSALDSYRSVLLPNIRQSSLLWVARLWHYSFLPTFLLCLYQVPCLSLKLYFKGIMTFNLVAGIPPSTHRKAQQPLRQAQKICACRSHPVSACVLVFHSCAHGVNLCKKAPVSRSGIWAQHFRSRFKKPKNLCVLTTILCASRCVEISALRYYNIIWGYNTK